MNYIIKGLGLEFEPFFMHIMARIDGLMEKLSLQELRLILQKYENKPNKFPHDFGFSIANFVNHHGTNVHSNFIRYQWFFF